MKNKGLTRFTGAKTGDRLRKAHAEAIGKQPVEHTTDTEGQSHVPLLRDNDCDQLEPTTNLVGCAEETPTG